MPQQRTRKEITVLSAMPLVRRVDARRVARISERQGNHGFVTMPLGRCVDARCAAGIRSFARYPGPRLNPGLTLSRSLTVEFKRGDRIERDDRIQARWPFGRCRRKDSQEGWRPRWQ